MQYRCLLKWKCPKFPSCSLCNVQLGIRWGSFVVLLWTICHGSFSVFSIWQSQIAIPCPKFQCLRLLFILAFISAVTPYCLINTLALLFSSAVMWGFFLCVCCQMSFVFQLFSASQHQACSGEMDRARVGIMVFSRWKDHKLGNKSFCNEGNQTCLSSYTYKDQYWDYACLVVLISVSFHY